MYELITQMKVPPGKSRAGGRAAIRIMLAVGLAATLNGCAMVGMMGVMHGGMLGRGSSDSGDRGSSAEGRQDGQDNRAPRSEPQG
ncbi:MAG: hypothetical protein Q8K18_11455 [Burkholderiales bacterium]|nr:hypothetical protein [Burkholderiales bacterium]